MVTFAVGLALVHTFVLALVLASVLALVHTFVLDLVLASVPALVHTFVLALVLTLVLTLVLLSVISPAFAEEAEGVGWQVEAVRRMNANTLHSLLFIESPY